MEKARSTADPWLGEQDFHLFNEGTHYRAYRRFGAHLATADGKAGVSLAVWAPNAESVTVIGDFNGPGHAPGRRQRASA